MIRFIELNYRKVALFTLFFIFVLGCPFVFAQQGVPVSPSELSGSSFMRFKDDLEMNFRNIDDLEKVNTVLNEDSVIQFPAGVTVYNQDHSINFNETIVHWIDWANADPTRTYFRPRYRNCPNGEEECPGVDTSEIYLPVKVVKASDPNFNLNGRDSFGYIALDYIKRNIDRNRYQTVRTNLADALKITNESDDGEDVISGGDIPAGSETTVVDDSVTPPRRRIVPLQREEVRAVLNCNDSDYIRSGYVNNNCLSRKRMTLKQKAELVMKDVLQINRLRKFHVDPRFSACIAYRESQFSPNAKGGSPDWGLYQIITSTVGSALKRREPVTPGFSQYRINTRLYIEKMIKSTQAQADLHHSVILGIAGDEQLLSKLRNNTMTIADYHNLAGHYNGGTYVDKPSEKCYAAAVRNCYSKMRDIANSSGQVTNESRLASALESARTCR